MYKKSVSYKQMGYKIRKLGNSEDGLVAILSVLIIMAILTLLTVGFTNVIRRAQTRTLNDQLNTQAFYAAETAINDARKQIDANLSDLSVVNKSSCQGGSYDYVLDSTLGIEYTCLLITTEVTSLIDDSVGEDPFVIQVQSKDGSSIPRLTVSWDSATGGAVGSNNLVSGSPRFTPAATWGNNVGVIRVDILPATSLSRSQMATGVYTAFLYPSNNSGTSSPTVTLTPGQTTQGVTVHTRCSAALIDYRCVANLVPNVATNHYYVRVSADFYNPVRVKIEPKTGGGGSIILINGQAEIDATGKAGDSFRRLRATVPIDKGKPIPFSFALLSGDSICKQIIGVPTNSSEGSCQVFN